MMNRSCLAPLSLAILCAMVAFPLPSDPRGNSRYVQAPDWPRLPEGWKFRMACNVAGDSRGRIFVAHRGAHPLLCFDREGKYLGSFGDKEIERSVTYNLTVTPATAISREYWLHGLHVDRRDNVWVTDIGRHIVMKFSPEGKLLLTLGKPDTSGETPELFNQPTALAVSVKGDIYVADGYGNSRVVKFSPEGRYVKAWGRKGAGRGEFDTPHGIAVGPDGDVYVAERVNKRVQVFDPDGRFQAEWPSTESAESIFLTRDGHALLGTGHTKSIFTLDLRGRRISTESSGGELSYAHGLFQDAEGSLYVADPVSGSAAMPPSKFLRRER
jgi:hypothetical protein